MALTIDNSSTLEICTPEADNVLVELNKSKTPDSEANITTILPFKSRHRLNQLIKNSIKTAGKGTEPSSKSDLEIK